MTLCIDRANAKYDVVLRNRNGNRDHIRTLSCGNGLSELPFSLVSLTPEQFVVQICRRASGSSPTGARSGQMMFGGWIWER